MTQLAKKNLKYVCQAQNDALGRLFILYFFSLKCYEYDVSE